MTRAKRSESGALLRVRCVEQEYLRGMNEVAKFLGGVSRDFVEDMVYSGQLPYVKMKRLLLFKVDDVRAAIESHRVY